jgi:sugar/nucleoside kinase (ribokinase family)
MNDNYILVLGASVVDIFGFCENKYASRDSIPGRIKMTFGGVCRNIAENLARMEVNTKFISVLGDDEIGREMIEHSRYIGYDMSQSLILKDKRTPTYLAVLDENGEMVSGINDMSSINRLDIAYIKSKSDIIKKADYVFLDADNPLNLKFLLDTYNEDTKFILDPISANKTVKILPFIGGFHTIKPNRLEAEVIADMSIENDADLLRAAEKIHALGVTNLFITLDKEGVFYSNRESQGLLKSLNPEVRNVTGAGDSFVAGIGYGYTKDLSIDDIAKVATTMAFITISNHETIHPELSLDKVIDEMKRIKWEERKFK